MQPQICNSRCGRHSEQNRFDTYNVYAIYHISYIYIFAIASSVVFAYIFTTCLYIAYSIFVYLYIKSVSSEFGVRASEDRVWSQSWDHPPPPPQAISRIVARTGVTMLAWTPAETLRSVTFTACYASLHSETLITMICSRQIQPAWLCLVVISSNTCNLA